MRILSAANNSKSSIPAPQQSAPIDQYSRVAEDGQYLHAKPRGALNRKSRDYTCYCICFAGAVAGSIESPRACSEAVRGLRLPV
jgi:hypothetical protein